MSQRVKGINEPCCKQASEILNLSQGTTSAAQASYSSNLVGHPRYHVLCKKNCNKLEIINNIESLGCTEVVTEEQHSRKSAFLTREDQNRTLHEILTSPYGTRAIDMLNEGRTEVILKTSTDALPATRNLMMAWVSDGTQMETKKANSTVLLLGHHLNKPEGTYVHVKTFYPSEQTVNGHQLEITKY